MHVRKYTDSRILVDFFSQSYGRISGVLRAPSKRFLSSVQPFQPIQVSWVGTHELKTILSCELDTPLAITLVGNTLFCGLYLNELLQRCLPLEDQYSQLFDLYESSLVLLSGVSDVVGIESVLRTFEFKLLEEMGLGLNFCECAKSGDLITSSGIYQYVSKQGFMLDAIPVDHAILVSGRALQAIANNDYTEIETRRAAKSISRVALRSLIGDKPIKSRELFH